MSGRKSARWMQQVDERILEYIAEDGWTTPQIIDSDARFERLRLSRGHIRERCEELRRRKLIVAVYSDMYDITNEGLAYLRGDLDAGHLPRWSGG